MYPGTFATSTPDHPAVIMGASGEVVTYRQLDERSNRLAHYLRDAGLQPGDVVAVLMDNNARYHEVCWGIRRIGLYWTPINSHLTAEEVSYILKDCGAKVVVASTGISADLAAVDAPALERRLFVGGNPPEDWLAYDEVLADLPTTAVENELEGDMLQYSSGTTGVPKGIKRPQRLLPISLESDLTVPFIRSIAFPEDGSGVYLSPAPLYHTAPNMWSMAVHRLGGTAVVMEKFDPALALELIAKHSVTHSLFVPTMFVRMLKLPEDQRLSYDVSSLRQVIHAAAPCPVDIKRRMIEWWGPIVSEFYSSSEAAGATFISAPDWLEHPGSVGRPMLGTPFVLDELGNELPAGEIGQIWFESPIPLSYHNDPEKTAQAQDAQGRKTVGDIGYVDADGFMYLTDRKSFMIISGGVNIYPQEAENLLVEHPKVMDAAVFGIPNAEFGEEVKAVVQPLDWADAGPELEAELMTYLRAGLASYKCPRSISFEQELPRSDTGKLFKKPLQQKYSQAVG
ncbi:MAG: acyl-CoA synthetase (AMP-forming)/AMP-acid ligase [Frankiales bacterium]|nr:acyl-CoA synthetase (AMP-forming)/AMP-acid ligase [Frankiales bacterium]